MDDEIKFLINFEQSPQEQSMKWEFTDFVIKQKYEVMIQNFSNPGIKSPKGFENSKYFVFEGQVKKENSEDWINCHEIWFPVISFKKSLMKCPSKNISIMSTKKLLLTRNNKRALEIFYICSPYNNNQHIVR